MFGTQPDDTVVTPTSYVALSRHKQDVKLYASKGDFKTLERMQQTLGRDGEKLSTLDFTDARQKQQEPELDITPSIFERIWRYFGFGKEQSESEQTEPERQYSGRWIDAPEPEHETEGRSIKRRGWRNCFSGASVRESWQRLTSTYGEKVVAAQPERPRI